ncbi:hypothetical protein [Salinibacter altiplanensis]|uniref:hypothetical protein n=1 Tax=Salinibacter altiplanensis TaxID=1803181 RepID=UPI000C9EF351|nr:hypothetical protein [Salinibacter altiplanensis]
MTDSTPSLDAPPDAAQIADLREQAADEGHSVEVTFPGTDEDPKRFVVSSRGTCVVLTNLREDSFNPSTAPEDIAAALQD